MEEWSVRSERLQSLTRRWWAPARARHLLAIWLLAVTAACGNAPTAASVERATAPGYAQRAAAQLQIETIPSQGESDEIWGRVLDLPLASPDLRLTATDGSTFDFSSDADAPITLLYFGYTSCPDVCPTHLAAIARALDELTAQQRRQIDVVFVTVDPTVDTPDRLLTYFDNFGVDVIGLTGTPGQVNDALASMGLPRTAIGADADEAPHHPSSVLGYTSDGWAHVVWPFGTTPAGYAHDLRLLIDHPWSSS